MALPACRTSPSKCMPARIEMLKRACPLALFAAFGAQAALAQDRPAAFVDAATIVPGLVADMRYAGSHNFVGRPIDGYDAPHCLLTQAAADALADVARDIAPRGLVIKVFDCYRPTRAVMNFVRWARDLNAIAGKAEFYPNVDKRTLFRDGYIASRSGHSRGSTVDLTLATADGRELDMGTPSISSVRNHGPPTPASARSSMPIACCSRRRCGGAAFAATTRNGGTSRCAASRSRKPISIFR